MVFPKDLFLKMLIENISRRQNSMENYPVSKVGYLYIYIFVYENGICSIPQIIFWYSAHIQVANIAIHSH